MTVQGIINGGGEGKQMERRTATNMKGALNPNRKIK